MVDRSSESSESRSWKASWKKSSVDSHPDLKFEVKIFAPLRSNQIFLVATCRTCAALKGLKCSQPQLMLLAFILLLTARAAPPAPLAGAAWVLSYLAPPARFFSLLRGCFQEHELQAIWVWALSSSSALQARERRLRAMRACARLLPPAPAA